MGLASVRPALDYRQLRITTPPGSRDRRASGAATSDWRHAGIAVGLIAVIGCGTHDTRAYTAGTAGPGNPTAVTPSVSGVVLQSEKDEVLRALGIPIAERRQSYDDSRHAYGDMIEMEYAGLGCRLVNGIHRRGPFRVLEVEVTDSRWVVTPGLSTGMDAREAQRRLPALKKVVDPRRPGEKLLGYRFGVANTQAGGELVLTLQKGRITVITLTSDLEE